MSRFKDVATADPRDSEIAQLRAQLATRDADLAAMTRNQSDHDRLAKIRKEREDDERVAQFRALPDAKSRLRALARVAGDYEAQQCVGALSFDDRVDLIRHADAAIRDRLRDRVLRGNYIELELFAIPDDNLPRYLRVTSTGVARGSERQEINEDAAAAYQEAGLGGELLAWGNGRIEIRGWSLDERPYRDVSADEWDLRLAVDRELRSLVASGLISVRPLTAAEVRQGVMTGAFPR